MRLFDISPFYGIIRARHLKEGVLIFVITALGLVALALGLYLLASHYNVTIAVGDVINQVICYIESFDHPFAIGIFLVVIGAVLLLLSALMRRSAYRSPP